MKFALAAYGSRGDVEPCVAVARELQHRGHDVRMAVSPNMLGLAEQVGLAAVAYGPDPREQMDPAAALLHELAANIHDPTGLLTRVIERVSQVKAEKSATLTSLAKGADLLVAGFNEHGLTANVAEYYRIPLAVLRFFPAEIVSPDGLYSQLTKETDNAQRHALGLPEATGPSMRGESLEIRAYDEFCLLGLAVERPESGSKRPFVGALTLELPTDADDDVLSWIADGTPPIYVGFGSTPVAAFPDTVAMISAACMQLGQRALICSGQHDLTRLRQADHVKVVGAVNHAAIFPACRAVVHHGGAGTTAAGMRAGIPTLILWLWLDQPMWAAAIERLRVGFGRHFSATTQQTLVTDLRSILAPPYSTRAREIAAQMTRPAESAASAADLLEETARLGCG
jgi:UDP:flavonoid glycosyltransferase YjiC (YdhE family)